MTRNEAIKILNLNDNFSQEELKRNYRSLVKKNHPDLFKEGTKEKIYRENIMKTVNEAYELLKKSNSYKTLNNERREARKCNNNNIFNNDVFLYKVQLISNLEKFKNEFKKELSYFIDEQIINYYDLLIKECKIKFQYINSKQKAFRCYTSCKEQILTTALKAFINYNNIYNFEFNINWELIDSPYAFMKLLKKLKANDIVSKYKYYAGLEIKKYENKNGYYDLINLIKKIYFLDETNISIYKKIKNIKTQNDLRLFFNELNEDVLILFDAYNYCIKNRKNEKSINNFEDSLYQTYLQMIFERKKSKKIKKRQLHIG